MLSNSNRIEPYLIGKSNLLDDLPKPLGMTYALAVLVGGRLDESCESYFHSPV